MVVEAPLVSIIIPACNQAKYIGQSINSALEQTWKNTEIIVINDGSTDNTLQLARTFESRGVKVVHQENKGASSARNRGLQEAKGQYIQFLDGDDLMMANKIEAQLKELQNRHDALCICPVTYFTGSATDLEHQLPDEYSTSFYKQAKEPFEFLLKLYGAEDNCGGMVPLHCWLTPRALIDKAGNWNESLTVNDDGEFFCRVVLQSKKVYFSDDTVCYYRHYQNSTSLSSGRDLASNRSRYQAILLIKQYLEIFKSDHRIQMVISRLLMELLMAVYPHQKELSDEIIVLIKHSGTVAKAPLIGGGLIEFIKNLLGWKTARRLQYYKQQLLLRLKRKVLL